MIGSVQEWARRHSISRQAAYKRLRSHGIPIKNGKVDFDAADAKWGQSVNPLQQARSLGRARTVPPIGRPSQPTTFPANAGISQLSTLAAAQLRRELIRIELEALELGRQKGNLLSTGEVRLAWSAMIIAAKNKLVIIADELCDKLAATSDPILCRQLVDLKIQQALSDLAEWPADK